MRHAEIGFVGAGGTAIGFMDLFRSGATVRKTWVGRGRQPPAVHPIEPVIDRVHPFGEVDAAFAGRGNSGKVVSTTPGKGYR
jgi:hypothetical protein